jgi:hypothetical protein
MTDKAGLYDLLHIPDPLRIGFVTIAAILVLSVLLGEKDFGLFKVPAMPWPTSILAKSCGTGGPVAGSIRLRANLPGNFNSLRIGHFDRQ